MSLKAGEVPTACAFAMHLLRKFGGREKFGPRFVEAGETLVRFTEVLRQGDAMPTADQMISIRESYARHLTCCKLSGVTFSPKHHLTCHMVHRTEGATSNARASSKYVFIDVGGNWVFPFFCNQFDIS
jgi:hypothetical protein